MQTITCRVDKNKVLAVCIANMYSTAYINIYIYISIYINISQYISIHNEKECMSLYIICITESLCCTEIHTTL